MDFEKFGLVSHTKESKAADFVAYLEQGKVMATRCRKCGTGYFPPKMDCPQCLSSDVEWFEIRGSGKLITYTIVYYGPAGFEDKTPYILGLSDFGDGVEILANFGRHIGESDITLGMKVKVAPIKLPGNRITYEFQKTIN